MSNSMFSNDEELSCPPLFDSLEGLEDHGPMPSASPLLDAALLNTSPLPEIAVYNNNPTHAYNPFFPASSPLPVAAINAPWQQSYSHEGVLSRPEDLIPLWPLESCIDSSSSTPTQQYPLACSSCTIPAVIQTEPLHASPYQGSASPAFHRVEFRSSSEDVTFSSSYSPSSSQELAAPFPVGMYYTPAADELCSTSPHPEFTPWNFPLGFDSSSPSSSMGSPLSSSISSPLPDIGFMSLCSPCSTRPPSSMDSEVELSTFSDVDINLHSEVGTDGESAFDKFAPISEFSPSSFDNNNSFTSYSSQLLDTSQETVFSTPSFNQLTTSPFHYDANNYTANIHTPNNYNSSIEYYCENGHDGNHVELNNNGNNHHFQPHNRDIGAFQPLSPHSHQAFIPYSNTSRQIQYLPEYVTVSPRVRAEYNNVLAELTALAPSFLSSNDPRSRAEYNNYHTSLSKIRSPLSDTISTQDEEDQTKRTQMHNGIKRVLGLPQQLNSTKPSSIRRIPTRAPVRIESSRSYPAIPTSDYAQQYRDTLARLMQKKAAKRSSEVVENSNSLDTFIRDSKIIRLTHAYQQFTLDPPLNPVPNSKKRKTKKEVIEHIHKQIPEFSTVPAPQVKTSKKPVREFWKQF